jgi:hypothetical protein
VSGNDRRDLFFPASSLLMVPPTLIECDDKRLERGARFVASDQTLLLAPFP